MDELMAARSLTTRPVVTLAGDAVAQVKDTVFDTAASRITGFALSGRGLLSGPLQDGLPWTAVYSLGHDAVMIRDRRALASTAVLAREEPLRGRVLGARVLTETGTDIGRVLDVVVEGGTSGRVVGFRVAAAKQFATGPKRHRRRVYVPRGESLTVQGRALVLPADAVHRVTDDPTAFAALADGGAGRRKGPLP
ncbi:photosystem reaction center subunit H [Streptomyces viridiviolaceus]|uniref:PRC-barrel domain-containing protein n=1 Tax=Streptomyces viridiviolaceus TaxID=68282 RepID=A0ABW2E8V9_9ACTN|nr:PRC-barrel domain-containing protein [Streptomyces viridiviolaceus]GHB40161.1 photosystem reaction center subunit H [Streptomyces viridiviolaceus]